MDDGASATPTKQTIEQTTIPSYAQPYVEEMLGAARANVFETDDRGNILGFQPYQAYTQGERMAQFTPLQLQAFESAQALGPADQGTAASHIAQQAGLAGLQMAYQPSTFAPQQVQLTPTSPYLTGAFSTPQVQAASMAPYQAGQFTPRDVSTEGYGRYETGRFAADRVGSRDFVSPTGAAQYFAQNPDVAQAYRADPMGMTAEEFARSHYERHGMAEGRDPYVATGAEQYFARNPDVAQAYRQNPMGMSPDQYAQLHYERYGMREGREPYSTGVAQQYMSPYMQNVVNIQQREAQRQADIAGQRQQAEAVKAGAFGGGRDAIMRAEAARNLAIQKGDIQAQGLQSAFQQAQAQYNTDQARRMQAAMANQQAGITTQQLGEQSRQYGAEQFGREQARQLQAALANQQAGMTAQQLVEQSRQFGAGQLSQDQARQLQAALANQQAGITTQQFGEQSRQFGASQLGQEQARQLQAALANQQYGLEAQRLGEQSRQYGAGYGLSGLQAALQSAGTLGQLGQTQFGQELGSMQQQAALGQQQQQQVQSLLQQQYQDFLNQQRYPYQQLGFMSDMLRGLPMGQTSQSIYQAPPSPIAQVAGLGTAIGGASGLAGVFRAKGGPVHSSRAGLADLMAEQI